MPVTAAPARLARSSRSAVSASSAEAVGVVAVQADLAAGVGEQVEGRGDAALVRLRLVAVRLCVWRAIT